MSTLSEYVKKVKEKKTGLGEILEQRKNVKLQELEEAQLDALIMEAKKKIQDFSPSQMKHEQATDFMSLLLLNRKPAEIKELLGSLTEEEIDKIAYMSASMNDNKFATLKRALREEPASDAKTVLEAVQTGVEVAKGQPQSSGTKDIIEAFRVGLEAAKLQNPSTTSQQPNTLETLKTYHEMFLKPVLDQLASRDKENLEIRMKQIESRQIDPLEYLKSLKQASADLGLSQTTRNEIDLKLEEMRELHDIEMAKLGFETRKWEHVKDSEGKTIEQVKDLIKTVGEGPIGKAIENLGSGAADKIRGGSLVKVQCPNCKGIFGVNPALSVVSCVHCGAQLAREQPSPQQPTSATTPQETPKEQAQPTQQEAPPTGSQQPEQPPAQ